jgi:hypothetical protein
MCYVLKVTGEPLGKKLANEIKDSAIVISEMFPLGHLDEIKQIKSSVYGVPEKIFIYRKPKAKVKNETPKAVAKTKKETKEKVVKKKVVAKKDAPKTKKPASKNKAK